MRVKKKNWAVLVAVAATAVVGIACSSAKQGVKDGVAAGAGTQPPAAASSAASKAPAGPATSFADGQYEVGKDIVAGTYSTTVPADAIVCYWEREKDFSGGFEAIIANGDGKAGAPVKVTIAPTDKGFKTQGCGTWTKS